MNDPLFPSNASTPHTSAASASSWERELIEKLALQTNAESKSRRRWKNFFRLMWLLFAFLLLAMLMGWLDWTRPESKSIALSHTAVVRINGVIESQSPASADNVIQGLRDAFKSPGAKGVILYCNTPGGSPVQAGRINAEIKRLRADNKEKPIVAVVDELCASGGYYAAVAAEKVYVDQASIVGSIGVVLDGFGATGAMEKLGIERRTLTAGENKAMLDPFSPVNPKHTEYMQSMLNEVHQQFIKVVKDGRGGRLKAPEAEVFSGLVYSGEKSVALGLADALGDVDTVARDVFKTEDIIDYTPEENPLDRLSKRLGATFGKAFATAIGADAPTLRWR
jgi:protease IV